MSYSQVGEMREMAVKAMLYSCTDCALHILGHSSDLCTQI